MTINNDSHRNFKAISMKIILPFWFCLFLIFSSVNAYGQEVGQEVFNPNNKFSVENRQFFLPLKLDAAFPKGVTSKEKRRTERITPVKPTHTKVEEGVHHKDSIVVKFAEGTGIRLRRGQLVSLKNNIDRVKLKRQMLTLKRILKQHKVKKIERLFSSPERELDWMKVKGKRLSGKELANLNLYYLFRINPKITSPEALINALNRLDIVEIAYPRQIVKSIPFTVGIAPSEIPPDTTPLNQDYITDIGVDDYVRRHTNGEGVGLTHVEKGWNLNHEDLRVTQDDLHMLRQSKKMDVGMIPHGTAVLGEIIASPNEYGVTGIAPNVDIELVAVDELGDEGGIIYAVNKTTTAGDIILSTTGFTSDGGKTYRPIEYYDDVGSILDTIRNAVNQNRIVIEAAGTGMEGFGYLKERPNPSGAIIVGAGEPGGTDNEYSRVVRSGWSSNYGPNVDLQGWGVNVATTGGDCDVNINNDVNRCYTRNFSGTSAAAPMVAGAAALIQSYYLYNRGYPLTPTEMQQLLISTGKQQPQPENGHIGPLVNVREAIETLDASKRPLPDLKGNDIDTGLTVTAGENVDITLSLDPRGFNDFKADWWIVAYVKDVDTWYYCNFLNNTCQWDINPTASSQGLLYNINSVHIYNGPLPEDFKDITLYFMVDLNPNGIKDVPYYLDCLNIKVVSPTIIPPKPDIKVNGSDGSIVIAPNTSIELTVSLDSGSYAGDNADWWLVANIVNSGLWYYYDYNSNEWIQSDTGGLKPAYQGPIEDLPAYTVYNNVLPPELNHVFVYSGVDLSMNGQLDLDLSYYDYVQVRVE